jgi:DNA helicase-2/ATP-dependent DNA helicase PcrA
MIKSNFLSLAENGESKLFDIINTAERMYSSGFFQYIPTASRVFAEGVLLEVVGQHQKSNDDPGLNILIKYFTMNENRPEITSSLRHIQTKGNRASHYYPLFCTKHDARILLLKSLQLTNYYLKHFKKIEIENLKFSDESLPIQEVLDSGLTELDGLLNDARGDNEALNKQVSELLAEKISLSTKISDYRADKKGIDDKLSIMQSSNDRLMKQVKGQHQLTKSDAQESADSIMEVYQAESLRQIANLVESKQTLEARINELSSEQISLESKEDGIVEQFLQNGSSSQSDSDNIEFKLDEHQLLLVKLISGKHFLEAPPGAGKTAVITARIKAILEQCTDDSEIVCLTFTTRAAREMKERAAKVTFARSPFIGNFHNYCLEIIRDGDTSSNLPSKTILDDIYRTELLNKAIDTVNYSVLTSRGIDEKISRWLLSNHTFHVQTSNGKESSVDNLSKCFLNAYMGLLIVDLSQVDEVLEVAKAILVRTLPPLWSAAKLHLQKNISGIEDAAEISSTTIGNLIASIFNGFSKNKGEANCIDFDDIIGLGIDDLTKRPQAKSYIQIDECQDLSPAQWLIIRLLSNADTHIFAVGDTQQSIYSFMGADIFLLKSQVADFEQHQLTNNYRSEPKIVELLNAYRAQQWDLEKMTCRSERTNDYPTVLIGYKDDNAEKHDTVEAIQKILKISGRNIGLLLSTNKACEEYAGYLNRLNVPFFRVNDSDLMQRPIIQDWLSLIRILTGQSKRTDWWRLSYRITRPSDSKKNMTRANSMEFVNNIYSMGVDIKDIINSDINSKLASKRQDTVNLFDYPLKQLVRAFKNDGVVIFDTETTGLDFLTSKIIQIAAVRVIDGKIVETFDQYVDIALDDNPLLIKQLEDSSKIHNISAFDLKKGKDFEKVTIDFLEFIGKSPLVAHNLKFDRTMLVKNLAGGQLWDLLDEVHLIPASNQFDTLRLARTLLPHLKSYKLESLLEEFNLDGVNSHNALDDVIATSSLLTYIINEKIEPVLSLVDSFINDCESQFRELNTHWPKLMSLYDSYISVSSESSLSAALDEWLEYASKQPYWYAADSLISIVDDAKNKLGSWLTQENYAGDLNQLMDDRISLKNNAQNEVEHQRKIEKLYTLREIDLIDKDRDRVVLSTIHRSKGLEFETVILPGITDGAFPPWMPGSLSADEKKAKVEESKRLLYVGLSRASNKLIVSYHSKFKRHYKFLSPYLIECADTFSFQKD